MDTHNTNTPETSFESHEIEHKLKKHANRSRFILGSILLLMIIGGVSYSANNNRLNKQEKKLEKIQNDNAKSIPLGSANDIDQLKLGEASSLVLNPTSPPSNPKNGQIYFDKSSNKLYIYNGSSFVAITSDNGGSSAENSGLNPSNTTTSNNGVLSVQGQTGAVSLAGGPGIAINGTTIANSGILGVSGNSSQLAVTTIGGNAVISILGIQPGGVLIGTTGNAISTALPASPGQCLISDGSNLPVFGFCPGSGSAVDSIDAGNGALTGALTLQGSAGIVVSSLANVISVDGSNFANATNISSGTLSDSRLSANVTLQGNTFNGISQLVQTTAGGELPVISGVNLTNVNAANFNGQAASYYTNATNIGTGTLADARLTTNVTLQGNTFNGISQLVQTTAGGLLPALSGINLTNVNAANLNGQAASYYTNATNIGTGTLADARLSANVALLNASNTFTSPNTFRTDSTAAFTLQNAAGSSNLFIADTTNTRIGIGTNSPAARLHVNYGNTPSVAAETLRLEVTGNISTDRGPLLTFYAPAGSGTSGLSATIGGLSSSSGNGQLVFSTAASSVLSEKVRITSAGNVGIGTALPGDRLHVAASGGVGIKLEDTTAVTGGSLRLTQIGGVSSFNEYDSSGTFQGAPFTLDASHATFRPGLNSTTTFQIQDQYGTANLFVADTTNKRLAVGALPATSLLTIGTNTTTATGGLTFGTDTNLYRSAANTLKTDGTFNIQSNLNVTGTSALGFTQITNNFLNIQRTNASESAIWINRVGDPNYRLHVDTDGVLTWGNGTAAGDTLLFRSAASTLKTSGSLVVGNASGSNTLTINGTVGTISTSSSGNNLNFSRAGNSYITATDASGYLLFGVNGNTSNFQLLNNGIAKFQNSNDSTTAFQIQNAAGSSNLFVADTTNTRLGVGALPATSLLTVGANTSTAAGGITFGTDTILYRSAAATLKTDSALVVTPSGTNTQLTVNSNGINFGVSTGWTTLSPTRVFESSARSGGPVSNTRYMRNSTRPSTGEQMSLFYIGRDTVNWSDAEPIEVTVRCGYYIPGYMKFIVNGYSYSSDASITVTEASGNKCVTPYLGSETVISGNIKQREVYLQIAGYYAANIEVRSARTEVSSITDRGQIQFTGTEATLGVDPGLYTGVVQPGASSIYVTNGGAGNVGVGTSNASTPLYVANAATSGVATTIYNTSSSNTNAALVVANSNSVTTMTGNSLGTLHIQGSSAYNDYVALTLGDGSAKAKIAEYKTGNGSYLQFGTSGNYTTGITNTALSIDWAGRVCIGGSSCSSANLGVLGTIIASSSVTSFGSPDIAETIPTSPDVEAADVVSADPNNTASAVKSSRAYDSTVIGVIADGSSAFLINSNGGDDTNGPLTGKPMVLAGRVPVKVTDEGGAIIPGDYLTSSSTPGFAMKATHAGPTIGKALGFFNDTSGTVMVQTNLSYADPQPNIQGSNGNFTDLNISGIATIQTLVVNGSATFRGNIIVGGHVITAGNTPNVAVGVDAGSGAKCTISGNDTGGQITIITGTAGRAAGTQCEVTFNQGYGAMPHPVITLANNIDTNGVKPYVDVPGSAPYIKWTVNFNSADTAQHTYKFNYFNAQ